MFRSLLFIPGNQPRMLAKALGYRPSAFVPDLEDSVPDAAKNEARGVVAQHIEQLGATGIPVIPRVNSRDTGMAADDLEAVVGPGVYGVSIGKVGTKEDVAWVDARLSELESSRGLEVGSLRLVPWIETALGVVNAFELCCSSPRIEAVAFGGEDFTHDMGIERLDDDSNVAFARNALCLAARAAGVLALDTPYFQFKNEAGLRENAIASKRLGFKGKFAIHPAQVEPLNEVFSPSADEIAYAQKVVAAFEAAEKMGRGSTSLDGKVIDVPVVKRARALLADVER